MQNSLIALAVLLSAQALAQQSNTRFSHTVETSASPEAIWRVWTDVPNWKAWDDGLKSAELNGPFATDTKGMLIPDKGPKSTFTLTEVVPGHSYTFRTKLPLGSLYVKRVLGVQNGKTAFTHEVWFTGLTKGIFGRALGRNYRAILPGVMANIKAIAES
jgi:hypothetical protein